MARCPQCNKFVSIEVDEPEIDNIGIENGQITAIFRVVKKCSECGEELEESYPEAEAEIEHEHTSDLEIEEGEVYSMERTEGQGQYKKTFYGAMTTVTITCSKCDFQEDIELKAETQAGHFDSLT